MFERDDRLIAEYKNSLNQLRKAQRAISSKRSRETKKDHGTEVSVIIDDRSCLEKDDQSIIQGMINDCEFALFWLEHGYEKPFDDEDYYRLPKHRRNQLWADLDDAVSWHGIASVNTADQKDKKNTELVEQLQEVLSTLSNRELELFKWRHEVMLTEKECAERMGISVGTVKSMSQRIRDKIDHYFEYGYQIELF